MYRCKAVWTLAPGQPISMYIHVIVHTSQAGISVQYIVYKLCPAWMQWKEKGANVLLAGLMMTWSILILHKQWSPVEWQRCFVHLHQCLLRLWKCFNKNWVERERSCRSYKQICVQCDCLNEVIDSNDALQWRPVLYFHWSMKFCTRYLSSSLIVAHSDRVYPKVQSFKPVIYCIFDVYCTYWVEILWCQFYLFPCLVNVPFSRLTVFK